MRYRFIITILISLLLFLGLIRLGDILISTPTGLKWLIWVIEKKLPGQLEIAKITGNLQSPLYLDGIHYQDESNDITIDHVELNWQLLNFLEKKIIINKITINNLQWQGSYGAHIILNTEGNFIEKWNLLWHAHINSAGNTIAAHGTVQGALLLPHLQAEIAPGNLHYPFAGKLYTLAWRQSSVQALFNEQGLSAQFNLIGTRHEQLGAYCYLLGYHLLDEIKPQQPIKGSLHAYLPQIASYLAPFLPSTLKNPRGSLQADVTVAGTLNKPAIKGNGVLQNGRVDIVDLGLHLTALTIKAQADNSKRIKWLGSAHSGAGNMQLTGYTDLIAPAWPSLFYLRGQNVQVSNTPELQAVASPNLTLKYAKQNLMITGTILLPQATLNLGGNEAISPSDDIVFINEKESAEISLPLTITSQLQLKLGEQVQFSYQGLKTYLRGGLTLVSMPNHPLVATGRMELIRGKYQYRGQTLDIRKGSYFLYSNNTLDNPILNIQAIKTIKDLPPTMNPPDLKLAQQTGFTPGVILPTQATTLIVGINVRGPAQNPQLSLFAEPSGLSQMDIISYLLTGYPSANLSNASAQLLLSAISNLSPGGGRLEGLMEVVQKKIGLDELAVGSVPVTNPATQTKQQNTTVTVGKRLSPRLSVRYIAGINQPTNTFQIRYLLSKYWTVQSTTSSEDSGVDLLYTIERN